MATAIILSGVVALTLTPALCAMILKNNHGKPKKRTPVSRFIGGFNKLFNRTSDKYEGILNKDNYATRLMRTGQPEVLGESVWPVLFPPRTVPEQGVTTKPDGRRRTDINIVKSNVF